MEIYWIEKSQNGETKQRCGPAPLIEIVSMLERGDLSSETKGWHAGCDAWLTLKELPDLQSYFAKKELEKALADEEPQREFVSPECPKIRVFIAAPLGMRCWARVFDTVLYLLIYVSVIRFFSNEFSMSFFTWWIGFPMPVLEACSLSLWGTTPGKFLMGLRVSSCLGTKLNFARSLRRSIYVFFFGTGMMLTLLTPFFVILSWWYTKKNGLSMWDQRVESTVEVTNGDQKTMSRLPLRILLVAALLFVMFEILGALLQAWLPAMEEALRQVGM